MLATHRHLQLRRAVQERALVPAATSHLAGRFDTTAWMVYLGVEWLDGSQVGSRLTDLRPGTQLPFHLQTPCLHGGKVWPPELL